VIRAFGTTAHPEAVATVPHGCPATIRAIGTTECARRPSPLSRTGVRLRSGRSAPRAMVGRSHHQLARRIGKQQAVDTPAERHRHGRPLAPVVSGMDSSISKLSKNTPRLGPRQRRPVHGVFGSNGTSVTTHVSLLITIAVPFNKLLHHYLPDIFV
jgi:hypothetical protein